jgi:oligopeptidase B
MAFSEDTQGRRIYTLRICDLVTGEVWEEERTGMSGAMAWANDNQHLFYTLLDEKTLRPFRLMRYRLGQKAERDVEVFQETDAT